MEDRQGYLVAKTGYVQRQNIMRSDITLSLTDKIWIENLGCSWEDIKWHTRLKFIKVCGSNTYQESVHTDLYDKFYFIKLQESPWRWCRNHFNFRTCYNVENLVGKKRMENLTEFSSHTRKKQNELKEKIWV